MNGRGYSVGFGPPQTPDVIKYLMIANVGVFILQNLFPGIVEALFAVWPQRVWEQGFVWQPATYMWLHSTGSVFHLLFNMFALWMFGSPVASHWGDRRFLRYYVLCGVGAGVIIAAWPGLLFLFGMPTVQYLIPTLGASGAVFGVLLAYALIWPDRTIMLIFPPIPIKAIWLIPLLFFMELFSGPSNVSHVGHLGGVLVGWILLQRMGVGDRVGFKQIKYRYRRWKMRRNLRAVQNEDRRDDHRTFH
ncbi:MAG: rhomboid family intramembrane serine protease [Deltaproteobacteria bacterium]|nr:rhomboid family intramembrane serine protease [Deltaproteobacteria bacterium]MBW2395196.1 rhomboid family intramembrane serine protease [Deltaproteobacteria bacterium]